MGQVATLVERHAEDGVARLNQREIGGGVGLRAGVWLDVGVVRAEKLLGAFDGQPLGLVHDFAAAVIALAGQPLGVFVGHHVKTSSRRRRR